MLSAFLLLLGVFEHLSRTCQEDVKVMEFSRGAQDGPQRRGWGEAFWGCCCHLIQSASCPLSPSVCHQAQLPCDRVLACPEPQLTPHIAPECPRTSRCKRLCGSSHRLNSGLSLFLFHLLCNFLFINLIKKTSISLSEH